MRIDIKRFAGDVGVASQALVIGRRWCFDMERQINAGIPVFGQRQDVVQLGESEASIRVRVYRNVAGELIGEVWVEVLGGCSDIPPFLLKRTGSLYSAYYNDGLIERIDPVTRQPRPDPDPAVRTKKVKVPDELLDGTKRGSKFSGLMRMAVQCAHARGVNTVFSYNWAKTHGIVEYLDQAPANSGSSAEIAAQSARNRYWVVEISAAGVFAAPVTWTGKCCDGFLVRQYLATGSQSLDLQWAYNAGRAGVTRLLTAGAMAAAYSATPFYIEHGWAFSRSGLHAQHVTSASTGRHYETKRWKIDFTITVVNNAPGLSAAAISLVESGELVFPATDPHWIPTGVPGEWSAIPRILSSDLTGAYSGPVHVFYQGETEFVTRYENSGVTSFPATISGDFTVRSGFFGFKKYGFTGAPLIRCGTVPAGWEVGNFQEVEGATVLVESVFTGRKSGFVTNHTSTGTTASTTKDREEFTSFYDGEFPDSIIPAEAFAFDCCTATMFSELRRNWHTMGMTDIYRFGTENGYSAAILLDGEREGILILKKTAGAGSQRYQLSHALWQTPKDWAFTAYGSPPPGACWTDVSGTGAPPGFGDLTAGAGGYADAAVNTSYDDSSGTYDLVLGAQHFTGDLPTSGGFVRGDIDKAFSNPIPPVNLNLTLLAFHGAMYYSPADLSADQPANFPPLKDQRNNAFWLFADEIQTIGGFTSDGTTPVAFVGQS